MKHLYIAGPYTKPDPIVNTNAALRVGMALYERELWVPHCPHLTLLWHMVCPKAIGVWYSLDMEHLSRCDAFVRLPGESHGADGEERHAREIGLQMVAFMELPASVQAIWNHRDVMQSAWQA